MKQIRKHIKPLERKALETAFLSEKAANFLYPASATNYKKAPYSGAFLMTFYFILLITFSKYL